MNQAHAESEVKLMEQLGRFESEVKLSLDMQLTFLEDAMALN